MAVTRAAAGGDDSGRDFCVGDSAREPAGRARRVGCPFAACWGHAMEVAMRNCAVGAAPHLVAVADALAVGRVVAGIARSGQVPRAHGSPRVALLPCDRSSHVTGQRIHLNGETYVMWVGRSRMS